MAELLLLKSTAERKLRRGMVDLSQRGDGDLLRNVSLAGARRRGRGCHYASPRSVLCRKSL